MTYENRFIEKLDLGPEREKDSVEIIIKNCVVNRFFCGGRSFYAPVSITNCVIKELISVGGYFEHGLRLSNCVITDEANFESGGHNQNGHQIIIENNVFNCFVTFLDAWYTGPFIFRNNVLLAGSNLLGNKDTSYKTDFDAEPLIENNIGYLKYAHYDPPFPTSNKFNMYNIVLESKYNNVVFLITEFVPEDNGTYLYAYENNNRTHEYVQKDAKSCKEFAFQKFGVPLDSWNEVATLL